MLYVRFLCPMKINTHIDMSSAIFFLLYIYLGGFDKTGSAVLFSRHSTSVRNHEAFE